MAHKWSHRFFLLKRIASRVMNREFSRSNLGERLLAEMPADTVNRRLGGCPCIGKTARFC